MRIGLIAMSGVRVQNQRLKALGLTLPGFIERGKVIASMPSLGLLTLAALTPENIDLNYFEIYDFDADSEYPLNFDLVAISSLSAQIFEAYKTADYYRKNKIPVIMGGLHVSSLPDEALLHCDAVVIGEGEPHWKTLLKDFQSGKLKKSYGPIKPEWDFEFSPIPRYDLLDISKYNRLPVQTSRGCPHRCNFCASSILLTSKYKTKSPKQVIREIQYIKSIWDKPFIEFADDNSFVRRDQAKDLLRLLARENIRWFTETDISIADDAELLELIAAAGCRQLLIGLESPNRDSLAGIEIRSDFKKRKYEYSLQAIDKIQSYGITVNGCFILGLDSDTADIFDKVLRFVSESGLYEVQVTVQTPFPGTPLYEKLKIENRLIRPEAWDLCTLFDVNYIPKQMSIAELENGLLDIMPKLYSQEAVAQRKKNFKEKFLRA